MAIVLDWYTKKIVGWDISLRSKIKDWGIELDKVMNKEFLDGVRDCGLKPIRDNGSQPTSVNFIKDMATSGIKQIFTLYNNPKGNTDTEHMIRTKKAKLSC